MTDEVAERLRLALLQSGAPRGAVCAGTAEAPPAVLAWGSQPGDATVEAGSVTKGVTGLLLALGEAAGEVSPSDEVGRFLRVGAAGTATLAELATHSSGLPRLPSMFLLRMLRHPHNPYAGCDLDRLLSAARRTRLRRTQAARYSNLGVALLGHALAAAAGTDYWTLATERVLTPLGMRSSGPVSDAQTWSAGPLWDLAAYSPAGGLRGPIVDLYALARLAADPAGSPLGGAAVDAMRPRLPMGDGHVGWCWMTKEAASGPIRWHNGGTEASWTMVAGGLGTAAAVNVGSSLSPAYDRAALSALAEAIDANRGPQAGGHD